jgi:hypothetical protein
MPRLATSAAQYGPYAAAGALAATSHSGPNSNTACESSPVSAASTRTRRTRGSRVITPNIVLRCLRSAVGSLLRCSRGSRKNSNATTESRAKGTLA